MRTCPLVPAAALAVALLAAASSSFAEKGDSRAPTQVESDQMQYDDLKRINVFTGNVVLTRGSIRLLADRLIVRQDPQEYQYATATGNPARFRQKRDGPGNQWIEGHAQEIDYDGKADTVRLQRDAMLRRTTDGRVVDEVHGRDILYESRTEFFTVKGGDAKSATPENPSGRVRVVIQPRDDKADGASERSAPATLEPADRLGLPQPGESGR